MNLTLDEAKRQIAILLKEYPNLSLEEKGCELALSGKILVNRSVKRFVLHKVYVVRIVMPLNTNELPYVLDVDKYIDSKYSHIYLPSHKLCLATDTDIYFHFIEGLSLLKWMKNFVEPYFLSYEYYQTYGEYPFGERAHGIVGILQSYQDVFETDIKKAYKIMCYVKGNPYRGHALCPCGSGQRIRNCHKNPMFFFYNNERAMEILKSDLCTIGKELNNK